MAEQAKEDWVARGAWHGVAEAGRFGASGTAGVTARLIDGLGFASLIEAPGRRDLEPRLRELTGLELPPSGRMSANDHHSLIWSGPGRWLLLACRRQGFGELLDAFSAVAATTDQSHARAALRISGAGVRDVLAKGAMIDLHPAAFPVHATAMTSIAHINVQIWRSADGPEGAVFDLLIPRSMAGSFWSWFSASAAEFGCVVTAEPG